MVKELGRKMIVDIDINKIVEKIDLNKLIEEGVMEEITEYTKLDNIIDNILEEDDVNKLINKRISDIIIEYLSSEDGKKFIIEKFEDAIDGSDILTDDRIIDVIANFLKKGLMDLY